MLPVVILLGCTSGGVKDDSGQDVRDVYGTFSRGEVRMRCGIGCAFSWGANRRDVEGLYQNQLWRDLAVKVSTINIELDISYFYLGRAAEGVGLNDAAVTYYRLSKATTQKCSGDMCQGISVPEEVASGLKRVAPELSVGEGAAVDNKPVQVAQTSEIAAIKKVPEQVVAVSSIDASAITVKYDEFTKSTTYNGKIIQEKSLRGEPYNVVLSGLVASKSSTGTGYSLVTLSSYEGKKYRHYRSATDISGESLPITSVDRNVECRSSTCFLRESMAIVFSREALEARTSSGIRIRLEGLRGSQIVELSAQYVASFLAAVPR
ncbi:hypothetical protein [Pseudomonas sp. Q1-7]|uniref:hypothetical protein n=1 Tax=Pseudomonas sp. Q1-7 TaxID=3020843 RepID=UPI002300F0A1|nr:hypothetical protein [Pseudomonas sp. Q1-7]